MEKISVRSKAEPDPIEELDFPSKSIDLEGDQDIAIAVTFKMSKTLYKEIGQIALDKEVSRASIIRQAIREHLKNLEHPEYEEFWNLLSDYLKQAEEDMTLHTGTTIEEVLLWLKEQLEQRKKEEE